MFGQHDKFSKRGTALTEESVLDPGTRTLLTDFRVRLSKHYGERLRGLILFGSRARGDYHTDSDADVAVFLEPVSDPVAEQMDIAEEAYYLFLDQGILIQPWVFRGTREDPDVSRAKHLLYAVHSEGVSV